MIFDTEGCAGCRSCEMACSYHHLRLFRPSASSIKIVDESKALKFSIQLCDKDEDGRIRCDNCNGEDEPFCVKYCSPLMRDELIKILNQFQSGR